MGTEQETLQLDMVVTGLDDLASLVAAQDKASASTDRLRDAQGKFVSASGASGGKTVKQQAQDIYDFADAYEVLGHEMQSVFTSAQTGRPRPEGDRQHPDRQRHRRAAFRGGGRARQGRQGERQGQGGRRRLRPDDAPGRPRRAGLRAGRHRGHA
jgi:hypothetical protein